MKLWYENLELPDDLEPLTREEIIVLINFHGTQRIFDEAPRLASSEEAYLAIERAGMRAVLTARMMRDGWNPK